MRSIAAGADALCLGHDLFDDSVVAVRDALVGAVRSGRLLRGAARRGRGACRCARAMAARPGLSANRDVGRDAARRALRLDGDARIDGPALVVELVPEVGMAAGRLSQLPGEWFQAVVPDAEVRRFEREPGAVSSSTAGSSSSSCATRTGTSGSGRRSRSSRRVTRPRSSSRSGCRTGARREPVPMSRRTEQPASTWNRLPRRYTPGRDAGWSSLVARRAHNPEVAGSNPAPATGKSRKRGFSGFRVGTQIPNLR